MGKVLLKFMNPWVIETSPGWSVMFKSPPNHFSNIRLIEGIVDTDMYPSEIHFPFFWDGCESGEWEIKAGDPLVHVVPFKRYDNMELQFDVQDQVEMNKNSRKHKSVFFDNYRKFWWHKRKQ